MQRWRWMVLAVGVLLGGFGLGSTSSAAPLPSSAALKASVGDGAVTQAWWGRRRWGYRRPYFRPFGFYRSWGYRRRFWGYRRPYYRSWGYRRPYYRPWGYRRPWGWRRRFY